MFPARLKKSEKKKDFPCLQPYKSYKKNNKSSYFFCSFSPLPAYLPSLVPLLSVCHTCQKSTPSPQFLSSGWGRPVAHALPGKWINEVTSTAAYRSAGAGGPGSPRGETGCYFIPVCRGFYYLHCCSLPRRKHHLKKIFLGEKTHPPPQPAQLFRSPPAPSLLSKQQEWIPPTPMPQGKVRSPFYVSLQLNPVRLSL